MSKFQKQLNILAHLLDCGVGLPKALDSFGLDNDLWQGIKEKVLGGETFSTALEQSPLPMNEDNKKMLVLMVKAGELGGVMEITIRRFIDNMNGVSNHVMFLRMFGMLVSSGVPVLEAIKNIPAKHQSLIDLKKSLDIEIRNGGMLSYAMLQADVFPRFVVTMVEYGELTGSFPEMVLRAADVLEESELPWYKKWVKKLTRY